DGSLINIGNFDAGTVYGSGPNATNNNTGGNNSQPQAASSFEKTMNDLTKWLKEHETEAMIGGLMLVVLLMRR
ncbi:hypothetical protein, partial [Listeria monocytogenes]|uniref:hypothetical protein n=1 Tax=Listeria monocytogenes TaxID=1639 RepID=UPI002FDBF7BC